MRQPRAGVYISINEAVQRWGISEYSLRNVARRERIRLERIGSKDWIHENDLDYLMREYHAMG